MRTAIVSDLHLGTTSGADLARRPDVFEPLAAALSEADRVVVLGDLLELRERPATEVLELACPSAAITRGNNLSRQVWSSSNPAGRRSLS
ncbi:MAG TPA: hypothetical protein VFD37_04860, partial [Solirubrobacterales bacterium]|nr:hypothetical protein [Solirubrobacterales bacterium]